MASNRVCDIRRYCHAELDGLYGTGETESMVRMLFEAFLGWNTTHLLLHNSDTINQSDLLRFHWAVEDLKLFRPIQHIIGYTDFCGCRITVSPDVLIPRPETEQLVDLAAVNARKKKQESKTPALNIIDLCTGSGCIAIALSKSFPDAEIRAVDVSEKALAIAQENARQNHAEVHFTKADVLDEAALRPLYVNHFDLIISNPPYVMERERAEMSHNVLDYEPSMALFVPNEDPLRFYRAIADFALQTLAPDGCLLMEINEKLGHETALLMKQKGFQCEVQQDFRNKERMIICRR